MNFEQSEAPKQSYMQGLLGNAASNAPTAPDDTFPRYGMSFLLPLPLLNQKGANFVGDFNPKIDGDNSKGNAENINFYPAFELIAFYGGAPEIPFEKEPTFTNEVVTPEEFDFGGFNTSAQNGYTRLVRTARDCADTARQEFGEIGYKQFNSLLGFNLQDSDKGLSKCHRLLQLILPLNDINIFPRNDKSVRIKNGFPFYGPFLDDIETFLQRESMQRIMAVDLNPDTRKVANNLFLEIREGVSSAIKLANRILNETEAEMKNTNGVKKSYDEPNLVYEDAPIPTDLYCLAHTNRTELDNKQLAASTNIGKEISAPITEAFQEMAKMFGGGGFPATVPAAKDVLTTEEVQLMLDNQREEFQQQMKDIIAEMRLANSPMEDAIVNDSAPVELISPIPPADNKNANKPKK